MILWDDWGLSEMPAPDTAQLALLDRTAEALLDPTLSLATIATLYDRDEFRVPATVTSHSPAAGMPRRVRLAQFA